MKYISLAALAFTIITATTSGCNEQDLRQYGSIFYKHTPAPLYFRGEYGIFA
jgi:hypothetical protein